MTLTQIEYFLKTVETGSPSKAAAELYVSQPTISRAISELETEFGVQLFYRGKKMVTTHAGTIFCKYATEVARSARELTEAIRDYKVLSANSLRVSYHHLDRRVSGQLFAALHRLSAAAPEVDVVVQPYTSAFEGLLGEKADCDLIFTLEADVLEKPGISYFGFSPDPVTAVMPASHPLAQHESLHMSDLCELPLLLPYSGGGLAIDQDFIYKSFSENELPMVKMEFVSSSDNIPPMVLAGEGIALVPASIAERYHFNDNPIFACIPVQDCDAGLDIVVAWRRADTNPYLHLLLSELRQSREENAASPAP